MIQIKQSLRTLRVVKKVPRWPSTMIWEISGYSL
jgi:hypothetical protein